MRHHLTQQLSATDQQPPLTSLYRAIPLWLRSLNYPSQHPLAARMSSGITRDPVQSQMELNVPHPEPLQLTHLSQNPQSYCTSHSNQRGCQTHCPPESVNGSTLLSPRLSVVLLGSVVPQIVGSLLAHS
ncbi:hypothetical protein XELAEV_18011872mg [Xenopus laevis]|uniref:Uncharacterized protein n=1 Tax=Xenopus laevis TaxID=8355 RepID=A0A974HXQ5_XENLA|nr:hypothetical protein XELAEV_18011872mg [Xenopus laevis]